MVLIVKFCLHLSSTLRTHQKLCNTFENNTTVFLLVCFHRNLWETSLTMMGAIKTKLQITEEIKSCHFFSHERGKVESVSVNDRHTDVFFPKNYKWLKTKMLQPQQDMQCWATGYAALRVPMLSTYEGELDCLVHKGLALWW